VFAQALAEGRSLTLDEAISIALALEAVAPRSDVTFLTPREREVAALLARGCTNRTIARELVISEGTAKVHVEHILAKLRLESRTQVVVWGAATRARAAVLGALLPKDMPVNCAALCRPADGFRLGLDYAAKSVPESLLGTPERCVIEHLRIGGFPALRAMAANGWRPAPLLFLHGAFGSPEQFVNQLQYFSAAGFTCYAPARRGRPGASPADPAGVTFQD
jgi:DNA-binding CsgD family transcriptional regulator